MPKSLSTIESHISDVADNRRKTQNARFKPLPSDVERVDDVLRQTVADLADGLAEKGFKPAMSKLSLSRKLGEITQTISLERVASNLSGVSVQIGAHVSVSAASYSRWSRTEGTGYASKYLWARGLGYLCGQHNHLRWQLVDPFARQAELKHLLDSISTLALPAFSAWANKESISEAVFRFTELERIDWLMSVALWAGDRRAARQLIIKHLQMHPSRLSEYETELAQFKARPTSTPGRPISGAAFLAFRHRLDVVVK